MLKTALVSSIFALNALSVQASGATHDTIIEKPICDMDFLVLNTLRVRNFLSTGLKASTPKYNMEIFAKAETGQWVLMGVSKDKKIARIGNICELAYGTDSTPYTQTSWFQQNFINKAKIGAEKTQPKSSVN